MRTWSRSSTLFFILNLRLWGSADTDGSRCPKLSSNPLQWHRLGTVRSSTASPLFWGSSHACSWLRLPKSKSEERVDGGCALGFWRSQWTWDDWIFAAECYPWIEVRSRRFTKAGRTSVRRSCVHSASGAVILCSSFSNLHWHSLQPATPRFISSPALRWFQRDSRRV